MVQPLEQAKRRKTQAEQVSAFDEKTLYLMRAEIEYDLDKLFHTGQLPPRLADWLDAIQPPSTIAREAATAAAAVLLAFERGYRMSQEEDRDAS
jgi:hypothetical protein